MKEKKTKCNENEKGNTWKAAERIEKAEKTSHRKKEMK